MRQLPGVAVTATLALTGIAPAFAADDPPPPHFVEDTATAGIDATYAGDWQYAVGGGVAAFDCAHDGRPSVLVAGGEKPAKFFRNVSKPGGPLRFEEETSGLEFDRTVGAYPIDIDGDGETDLVILRVGGVELMRGLGHCRFERANEAWGFKSEDAWWTSFSATWEKGQAWPTLAFGSYYDRTKDVEPWGTCTQNLLYRPAVENGAPQRRFADPAPLEPSFCPLSMLFSDWNRSGTPSLRVANDREYYEGGQEQMWRIAPGEAPHLYTEKDGWKYLRIWGMGIASYDLTGSGYPDYYVTSMADQKLQRLDRPTGAPVKPSFSDLAFKMGASAHRPYAGGDVRPSTGWHAQFEDVTNSGRPALFVAKGNVSAMPDFAAKDPSNLLQERSDGTFVEVGEAAGILNFAPARGAALADFNLDGAIDLLIVNRNAPSRIWRNDTKPIGHWLAVQTRQDGPNRNAIGAWIEVRCGDGAVQRRELTIGGGHAGGQLTWTHFGLGDAPEAEVRVLWPDGAAGPWTKVAADAFYVLKRDAAAERWTPPS